MPTGIPPGGSIPPGIRKRAISISTGGFAIRGLNRTSQGRSLASWDGTLETFKKPVKKFQKISADNKYPRRPIADILDEKEEYRIIIELPYHQKSDFKCEIKNGFLVVESLLVGYNYHQSFPLPNGISEAKSSFGNNLLQICWKKSPKP